MLRLNDRAPSKINGALCYSSLVKDYKSIFFAARRAVFFIITFTSGTGGAEAGFFQKG